MLYDRDVLFVLFVLYVLLLFIKVLKFSQFYDFLQYCLIFFDSLVFFVIDIIKEAIMLFHFLINFGIFYDVFYLQLLCYEMDCLNDKGMVIIIMAFVCLFDEHFGLLVHVPINKLYYLVKIYCSMLFFESLEKGIFFYFHHSNVFIVSIT